MRPTRLELEGFSTFREPTELIFDDLDLVAFVGSTGSGKSTLIDAMTFALYGSVARYDDARLVAPAINQGCNEAKVRLDFELAGSHYTAVRIVRRTKSGATTKEARLEGEAGVLASGAKELTLAVENLIGLDFAQFTRTVVLPQGQFAEFLRDDAASRQRLLRRLLGLELYSKMGSMARERAKEAGQHRDVLNTQRERYNDVSDVVKKQAEAQLGAVQQFGTKAARVVDELGEVDVALATLRTDVNDLDGQLTSLRAVDVPPALGGEGAELVAAQTTRDAELQVVHVLRAKQDAATREHLELGDPSIIESQIEAHARLGRLQVERSSNAEVERVALIAVEQSASEVAAAQQQRERAREQLRIAQTGLDAQAWAQRLSPGMPCPVCEQTVTHVPDHDRSAQLANAVEMEATADAAVVTLSANQRRHQRDLDSGLARAAALLDEEERTRALLTDVSTAEVLASHLVRARTAKETVFSTSAALKNAEVNAAQAERSFAALRAREASRRDEFGAQRDLAASLSPPRPVGGSLVEDWQTLRSWAETQTQELLSRRESLAERGKIAAGRKSGLLVEIDHGAQAIGLVLDLSVPSEIAQSIAREQVKAEATVSRIVERLAHLSELDHQIADLDERRAVQAALGQQLSASGFERWLLVEAMEELVERATVRLLELSAGQYSLISSDTAFRIVDHHNADETRDVRTLSGGETFLASLALALALSDSIADLAPVDAPRLGSVFLDEGFGTLDPGTLDTVAVAIEDLSASGRLVGIVTHIDALAERMPVQFAVEKGPTSSTVRRVVS